MIYALYIEQKITIFALYIQSINTKIKLII